MFGFGYVTDLRDLEGWNNNNNNYILVLIHSVIFRFTDTF